jgi:hypothetical protein
MAFVNDFLGEPPESAMSRRARAGHGVYGVKLFDFARPNGQYDVSESDAAIDPDAFVHRQPHINPSYSNRTVAVFVLDVRTNKTPWKKGSAAYIPDQTGDFLGERQWEWFESAIRRSRASVNIVVNGLQVHANRFPDGNIAEAWGKFPRAQQRLFDNLLQPGVSSPVLISGDVHMAQMMRKDCVRRGDHESTPRALVELTTSGMTHSWGTLTSPPLFDPSTKPTWMERYQTFVAGTLIRLLHYSCPWTDLLDGENTASGTTAATKGLQFSLEKNFGELEFDWDRRIVSMKVLGENFDGANPLLFAEYSLDQLSGHAPVESYHLTSVDFGKEATMQSPESEWICINHRGRDSQLSHMLGHLATGVVLTFLVPFPLFLPGLVFCLLARRASTKSRNPHPIEAC